MQTGAAVMIMVTIISMITLTATATSMGMNMCTGLGAATITAMSTSLCMCTVQDVGMTTVMSTPIPTRKRQPPLPCRGTCMAQAADMITMMKKGMGIPILMPTRTAMRTVKNKAAAAMTITIMGIVTVTVTSMITTIMIMTTRTPMASWKKAERSAGWSPFSCWRFR